MDDTLHSNPLESSFWQHIDAAFHGPNVCELEGPTPILNMSNTDIGSCGKTIFF